MNITNPFTKAARTKLRFDSGSGHLTSEDLFDLSLKDLDRMGRAIRTRINDRGDGGSLLDNPDNRETAAMKEDQLRFDIIKAVIDIRQTENREKKTAADKAAELKFLNSLLEKKKMDKLEGMDLAEIEARIAAIEGGDTAETPAEETAGA